MSRLRARCPDCRTYTAVALGPEYQCHACGRSFGAGLVRVPRAWGAGGGDMARAANLDLPYPEAGVIEEESLAEQTLALASDLPDRPLVLGGCCCAHIGAVEGLAARHGRVAVVWLDAHGDLNTAASSPSGNAWGMPLRMLLDGGTARVDDVALVGARRLDPGEEDFIETSGLAVGVDAVEAAIEGTDGAYVALDCDVLEPGQMETFMPETGGLALGDVEQLLREIRPHLLGLGLTGLREAPANVGPLAQLAAACFKSI